DERKIAVAILVSKVGQETGPLTDHHEQPTPAGVIFLVHTQMLSQLIDPRREQGNLHFRRTGVRFLAPVFADDLRFAVLGNRHLTLTPSAAYNPCLDYLIPSNIIV